MANQFNLDYFDLYFSKSLTPDKISRKKLTANLCFLMQSVKVVKKIDYSLNSELKKLQFFGAGPKTALPNTLVDDPGQLLPVVVVCYYQN